MAIVPEHGSIEIGHIWFSPELQRTPAATEAIFLLARHAFDELGYRRLEWKCNALNQPSRDAAARFGFEFEGVFLQHRVVKGRNRDTAWFAITDTRWPAVRAAFEQWLSPDELRRRREYSASRCSSLTASSSVRALKLLGCMPNNWLHGRERAPIDRDYQAIVESVPAIVFIADTGENGPWHYVNEWIEPILGFTVEEWTGDPGLWARQLHPEDREAALAAEERGRGRAARGPERGTA